MLHYTPPQLQEMNSSTLSPFAKAKRFSTSTTSQDKQPMPQPPDLDASPNPKRSSKLTEFMSRSRTASLPPRPHTSNGPSSSKQKLNARLGTFKGKGKDKADMLSPDMNGHGGDGYAVKAAASSMTSVADPFAANPSATASFVTYSPVVTSPTSMLAPDAANTPMSRRNSKRPTTAQSIVVSSPSASVIDMQSPPTSPTTSVPPSQSSHPPSRRRGSLLVAASDALSTFARKTPRSLHIGRQQGTKSASVGLGIHTPQPIVLTEVIEISESAVRASKRREAEEEERERLRDAAAKALGMGELDVERASVSSRTRLGLQDPGGDDEHSISDAGRDNDGWFDAKTPVAASRPEFSHSRSRSGSYIPPHAMPFTQVQSTRPSTPSISTTQSGLSPPPPSALSTSVPRSPLLPPSPPPRNPSAKSLSSPPTLSVNTLAPLVPQRKISMARLRGDSKSAHDRALPPPKIPPFPSTNASLKPFVQRSATVPRYYPAPSLLMFALSKQWKNRYLVLTSPLPPSSGMNTPTFTAPWGGSSSRTEPATPAPSYLHLFKGSGPDERELERLEINEDSVVYIVDTEVGGRGNVIKVGGLPKKKPQSLPNPRSANASTAEGFASRTSSSSMGSVDGDVPESVSTGSGQPGDAAGATIDGRTVWALQIVNPEEAQAWIAAIKGAVLSQRSIRAGLGTGNSGGIEPRGDLDVVLSMRALHSPISPRSNPFDSLANGATARLEGNISPTTSQFTDASRSSPTSSLSRSQSLAASGAAPASAIDGATSTASSINGTMTPPPRTSISATTAIKSLFTIGGRPRSPSSVSASGLPSNASATPDGDSEIFPEDSFGHAGTSLLGMLQSNSFNAERPMSLPTAVGPATPRAGTPVTSHETHPVFLEQKILPDSDRQLLENESLGGMKHYADRRSSITTTRERAKMLVAPQRVSSDGVSSPSLQPPPRKRAGTVSTVALSISSPSESESYTYTHANRSTAESLGVQNPNLLSPSPPMPALHSPNSARPKDRRARASWSSVSTYGSNEQSPSSPDEARSRRWSRRGSLPHRMSPPYPPPGSPPSSPKLQSIRTPASRHPYAAETSPLSRSPSIGSGQSHVDDLQSRQFSAKRASVSSMQSFSTSSTSPVPAPLASAVSGGMQKFGHRPRSSHRTSMPPPQRPAPNSALPPTPGEGSSEGTSPPATEEPQSAPPSKLSFRESLLLRSKRHSASPPSMPPTTSLPPRPDELLTRSFHRRSSSSGSNASTPLCSIPASPTLVQPAFPPPSGPLPPTPQLPATPSSPTTASRHSSLTRRFRRISSPPTTNVPLSTPGSPDAYQTSFLPSSPPSPIMETAVHAMPIGEPITTSQNDPNFLNLSPPTPPGSDLSFDVKVPDTTQGPTPLSPPPPRRSSRQVSIAPEHEQSSADAESAEDGDADTGEAQLPSDIESPTIPRPPPEVDDFAPASPPIVL